MMTRHSVITSSLRIKILKIDKFGYFSGNIDYNSRTDVFGDAISHIINQCNPRRTQSVRQPCSASKRSALVIIKKVGALFPYNWKVPNGPSIAATPLKRVTMTS